jgi:hypothetical protein
MRLNPWSIVFLAGAVIVAGCGKDRQGSPTASESGPNVALGTATIKGTVTFEGPLPAPAPIDMNSDSACASMQKTPVYPEDVVVNGRKLQNVFVYVKHGLENQSFAPPAEPAVLSQEGCRYTPHVLGMMVNQKLRIVNGDETLHNVHCQADKNGSFNLGQPLKGMEAVRTFPTAEVMIHFKCDVHKWMSAYIGVLPHPYFGVTGEDGTFALKDLPPGEYTIEAWHEKLGTQNMTVRVSDKETKEISFSFKSS